MHLTSYEMQIKVRDKWVSVRPSGKTTLPYRYETEEEARYMLDICYPLPLEGHLKRTIKVNHASNSEYLTPRQRRQNAN